ncbi:MAG: hypothetical protein ACR2PV_04275 [Gammaproteobacteria bacterium]
MSLKDNIKDIQSRLKKNAYPNEQAISQGIVLPLLGAMGWPVFETDKVVPEYRVQSGRVDFALCAKPNKPDIFIEVKQPGGIYSADTQLFTYAFHEGVQVAIATDGREWYFYWPSGEGSYERRKFCAVNLVKQDVTEAAAWLQRYLLFNKVVSKEALRNAENDYKNLRNKRDAMEHIPHACEVLLRECRPIIVKAISDKVKNLCGYMPDEERIIEHLDSLKVEDNLPVQPGNKSKGNVNIEPSKKQPPLKIKVTFPNGTVVHKNSVKDTFIETLRKIGFAKAARAKVMMKGHPLISREQHDQYWENVGEGFFVCKDSESATKEKQLSKVNNCLELGLKIERIKS